VYCTLEQYVDDDYYYLFCNLVSSSSDNPRGLWQTTNKLLNPLQISFTSACALADSLASFFSDKISKLRLSLANSSVTVLNAFNFFRDYR